MIKYYSIKDFRQFAISSLQDNYDYIRRTSSNDRGLRAKACRSDVHECEVSLPVCKLVQEAANFNNRIQSELLSNLRTGWFSTKKGTSGVSQG